MCRRVGWGHHGFVLFTLHSPRYFFACVTVFIDSLYHLCSNFWNTPVCGHIALSAFMCSLLVVLYSHVSMCLSMKVMERRSRLNNNAGITSEDKDQPDPSDGFVKEVWFKRHLEICGCISNCFSMNICNMLPSLLISRSACMWNPIFFHVILTIQLFYLLIVK